MGHYSIFPVVEHHGRFNYQAWKIPCKFWYQSRQWFINKLPNNFATVQRLEAGMDAKRITLSNEDKIAIKNCCVMDE